MSAPNTTHRLEADVGPPNDVVVIDDEETATVALEPSRRRILSALARPGSSTSVAAELGEPRQRVNHHLRSLERHGLVQQVGERPRRGVVERIMVASARQFVLDPGLIGGGPVPAETPDRLSSSYLLAVAARLVSDVAALRSRAVSTTTSLATLTIEADIRFASAADRARFTRELSESVATLAAAFHDESAPRGRWHRLIVAAHPRRGDDRGPSGPDPNHPDSNHPELGHPKYDKERT